MSFLDYIIVAWVLVMALGILESLRPTAKDYQDRERARRRRQRLRREWS